jgi:hypothetical protein
MSTAKFDTLQNVAGTKSVPVSTVVDGSAKAWVNFNGTGTVAIRASFNVSSITDNGTGDYTVNFTTAMPDANYSMNYGVDSGSYNNIGNYGTSSVTASSLRIYVTAGVSGAVDSAIVSVAIFR